MRASAWAAPAALVLAWTLFPPPAGWVESVYARGLYRAVAAALVPASDWTGIPAGAVLLAALAVGGLAWAVAGWFRGRRRGAARRRLALAGLRRAAIASLLGYSLFLVLWGAGYRRRPLEERLELDAERVGEDEVADLAAAFLEVIERDLRPPEERDGARALDSIRAALREALAQWDGAAPTLPHRVKRLPAGWLLAAGSSGMTFPFTLEALVDGALPETAFLAVAAHELAHVGGLNGEAEADLAAAAGGLRASDPYARYAVSLGLFDDFTRALPGERRLALLESLPAAARQDLEAAHRTALERRVRWLAALQRMVYDAYLRWHGVREGVRDYSRAVKLIARAHRRHLLGLERAPAASPEAAASPEGR